jgi:ABC-type branched-subunit amino acid transport system substrate-binding protein
MSRTTSGGRGALRRQSAVICLAVAVSLLATACASSDSEGDTEGSGPVSLYASLGLSGSSSSFAPALEAGIQAAVTTINDRGGLIGRQIKLEVENNESDPTKAVSNLQERIREDAPDLVWAGSTSSETLAMLGITTREKVTSLNNGSAPEIGDASTFPYSFSAGVGNEAQANFLAAELTEKGYETVGVLTATGAFGEALRGQYEETFEAAGLEVISETYEPDAVEMDGPLARIDDKNPDAVVFNDFVHPSYVLKSRTKIGMGDIPFYGDISTTINDISGTLSEEEKRGVELASYSVQTTAADRPGVDDLVDALDEANVKISTGLYLYALAYDTVLAYANAVESVKSMDVDEVRSAMEAGAGDTYRLALTDDVGWTEDVHIGSGEDSSLFTLIPVSPMKAGQFQLG